MRWPSADTIQALAPLPAGYRYAQFGRAHIAPLIASLRQWHPHLGAGANGCFLREDFYLERVGLDGDQDRDVMLVLILHGQSIVGCWSYEREVDSLAIWGRLLVIAPEHRGAKVSGPALAAAEGVGRVMGAAFLYGFAPLSSPYVQLGLERAGFRLLGFFPGRDREEVSPGVLKRVYQAVYAKLLVPEQQLHWPDPAKMTPRARAMYGLLFPERAGRADDRPPPSS